MTFEGSFAAAITSHYFQSNLLPDKFPRLSLTNPHQFLARPIMQLRFEQGVNAQTVSAATMAHEADHALDLVIEPYELKSSTFVKVILRELKAYHVSASVTKMMIGDGLSTTKADRISLQIDIIRNKYTKPGELIPTGNALNAMLHEINDHKLLNALGITSDKQTP